MKADEPARYAPIDGHLGGHARGAHLFGARAGPGFAVDEDPATLGEKVVLPPFLEPQRERIVPALKPID